MSLSADLLALILLLLAGALIFFLQARFGEKKETVAEKKDRAEGFFRQEQFDPTRMTLPITGLSRETPITSLGGFLSPVISQPLLNKQGEVDDKEANQELTGLFRAELGTLPPDVKGSMFRLSWISGTAIVLLGLSFILIWLLSFF